MAKPQDIAAKLENAPVVKPTTTSLEALLKDVSIKQRFEDMLGKKAAGFISSVLTLANQKKELKCSDPKSILAAAAIAASLDLPINPSLGMAHIVPYSGKAQFQMGWRGYVQLAMRTGQYKTMNVSKVYEGEIKEANPFTGEFTFDISGRKSDTVIGYVSYFRLLNGFEKYMYMTKADMEKHGKRYSKSYATGQWTKDFDAMALKTVVKQLLSKWGVLSIEMQSAITKDQAVAISEDKLEYMDNSGDEAIFDAEVVEDDFPPETTEEIK